MQRGFLKAYPSISDVVSSLDKMYSCYSVGLPSKMIHIKLIGTLMCRDSVVRQWSTCP